MVSCLSIVKALQATEVDIRGLGRIVVDPTTIEVGNNCVVARCIIPGTEGDMLIKCYHRGRPLTEFFERTSYYLAALQVISLGCGLEYVDVAFSEWIEGNALDIVLYQGACDYVALSRAFDRMALSHKRQRLVHGDVKPENIIITPDGSMRLVDIDLSPTESRWGYTIKEYGSMLYAHRHRHLRRTDEHTDDYPLALISVLLAAMAVDAQCFPTVEPMSHIISIATDTLHKAGDMAHYKLSLALQASIMGKIDYLEELLTECLENKGKNDGC
jgi:serine/threonine protein kinase